MDPSNEAALLTEHELEEESKLWRKVRAGVDQTTRHKIFEENLARITSQGLAFGSELPPLPVEDEKEEKDLEDALLPSTQ